MIGDCTLLKKYPEVQKVFDPLVIEQSPSSSFDVSWNDPDYDEKARQFVIRH
jgi:hypothetical protein